MSDPRRLIEYTEGDEALAAQLLQAARAKPLSTERHAALYWSLRDRASASSGRARLFNSFRRPVFAAVGCAALAAALLLFLWPAAHELAPGNEGRAPSISIAQRTDTPEGYTTTASLLDGWRLYVLPGIGTFELRAPSGESLPSELVMEELPHERRLRLGRGELRAFVQRQSPERPVVLQSPHLRIVVLGTRFDLNVDRVETSVELIEGTVRVESALGQVMLYSGERILSSDARLNPIPSARRDFAESALPAPGLAAPSPDPRTHPHPARAGVGRAARPSRQQLALAPAPAPARVADCEQLADSDEREECLARLSQGEGFAAQNALYSLGIRQLAQGAGGEPRALGYFTELSRRFPSGVLAPEAYLRRLELLRKAERSAEALAVAEAFAANFPSDPRTEGIALVRLELTCRQHGLTEGALRLIERLEFAVDPALRSAASRLREECARSSRNPTQSEAE